MHAEGQRVIGHIEKAVHVGRELAKDLAPPREAVENHNESPNPIEPVDFVTKVGLIGSGTHDDVMHAW
jgi:hypothetical protein